MPFFDADKFVVRVEFAQADALATPVVVGSSVLGNVIIDVLEDCQVRGVLLQYFCDALHYTTSYNGEGSQRERERVKLRGHAAMKRSSDVGRLHSVQYVLIGSRKGPQVSVVKGTYRYPFAIPVPAHLPATVLPEEGGHFAGCCECCCTCCEGVTLIGVRHQLKLEVVIPNSFYDNQSKWPFTVISAVHPLDVHRLAMPPIAQYAEPATCGSCLCESVAWALCRRPHDAVRLSLRLPRVVVAIRQHYSLPFEIIGSLPVPMHVTLVRTLRLFHNEKHENHRDGRIVVASQYLPPNPEANASTVTTGEIPLVYSMLASTQLLPSINSQQLVVSYHVEVEPVLSGCCVAFRQGDLAKVPVIVVHDILPHALRLDGGFSSEPFAQPPGPVVGASVEMRGPTFAVMGGGPEPTGPRQPWPWQAPPEVEEATYAYVPPPGQGGSHFNPAGTITDALPPAVWGVPLERLPDSTRGLVDPYGYPGPGSSASQRSARVEEDSNRKENEANRPA